MRDDTQPEAMDLADWLEAIGGGPSAKRCAALLREQHARIAELESELEAVGAGGVSGPLVGRAALSASPTPPAEQQAAPKAAPGEPDKLMRDCLALLESFDYEDDEDSQSKAFFKAHINADWFFHVKRSIERQLEAKAAPQQEPVGVVEHAQAQTSYIHWTAAPPPNGAKLYTAPQPAPAPLSEMPYEKRNAIQEGEQISASDAWFKARHEMLDTLDRRSIFRAGFDRGWNAAIAAQGGI